MTAKIVGNNANIFWFPLKLETLLLYYIIAIIECF